MVHLCRLKVLLRRILWIPVVEWDLMVGGDLVLVARGGKLVAVAT